MAPSPRLPWYHMVKYYIVVRFTNYTELLIQYSPIFRTIQYLYPIIRKCPPKYLCHHCHMMPNDPAQQKLQYLHFVLCLPPSIRKLSFRASSEDWDREDSASVVKSAYSTTWIMKSMMASVICWHKATYTFVRVVVNPLSMGYVSSMRTDFAINDRTSHSKCLEERWLRANGEHSSTSC